MTEEAEAAAVPEGELKDFDGNVVAILGLTEDGKVASINYIEPYAGENLDAYLEAGGWEVWIMP